MSSLFDDWSSSVARLVEAESAIVAGLREHKVSIGVAREALVRGVLSRVIPDAYEIGTGEVVDRAGNRSKQVDIVIARRDFPRLSLPDGSATYLVESVVATIEVKSKLSKSTIAEALDNCASVVRLNPNIVDLDRAAASTGWKRVDDLTLEHPADLARSQLSVLVRPATYVYGFTGYKNADDGYTAFKEAIIAWAKERGAVRFGDIPSVVAGEGCFAWRNAPPYEKGPSETDGTSALCLVGTDPTPLRILLLHLLYTLSKAVPPAAHSAGHKVILDGYLRDMAVPDFREWMFPADDVGPHRIPIRSPCAP